MEMMDVRTICFTTCTEKQEMGKTWSLMMSVDIPGAMLVGTWMQHCTSYCQGLCRQSNGLR